MSANRTHNKRTIYVLLANSMIIRAYSDQREANDARQDIAMVRPQDAPMVVATYLLDHQTIDSIGRFGRINADWT